MRRPADDGECDADVGVVGLNGGARLLACRAARERAREMFKRKQRTVRPRSRSRAQSKDEILARNSESSAAARYARDVYVQHLEEAVATGEKERVQCAEAAALAREKRDQLADEVRRLTQMLGYAPAPAPECSTEKLLEGCGISPKLFAELLLRCPTCAAL